MEDDLLLVWFYYARAPRKMVAIIWPTWNRIPRISATIAIFFDFFADSLDASSAWGSFSAELATHIAIMARINT